MSPRLRASWRAAIFVGAHIIVLFVAYVLVALPLVDIFKTRDEEIDAKAQLLASSREALARLNARAGVAPPMRDRSSIFTQANDGVGAAMLQSKLKALADAQGVMIVSQRATDSRPFGGMTMRRARIELSGATRDVANVVRAIETSQAPALFIAGATVRVSTSAAPANGQAEPLLDAQIDVEAPFQTAGEPL